MKELSDKTVKDLMKKGWSKEDIKKVDDTIKRRMITDKSRTTPHINRTLFWIIFLIIIISNFIVSILLIPFLLVLDLIFLDFIIIVLGLSFGSLFNFLIKDVRNLHLRYHLIAGVAIPVIAIFNFFIMTAMANSLNSYLNISAARQSPMTISIIYVVAFILPYLVGRIREYKRK